MPDTVSFKSNGSTANGFLYTPPAGRGPGILMIQEWWGVDPSLKANAERLASFGFVVLVPDLYHGELAEHDEMDKAAHLMNAMDAGRAARDMSGGVDFLLSHPAVTSRSMGVVGFCMGGMLSFLIAANRGDAVKALVPFYGFPQGGSEPDWTKLTAKVRGHMAERDSFFPPDAARALEAKLRGMGKDVVLTVHPGTGHAFMGPHNALGNLDVALSERIWPEVVQFLTTELA